MDLNLTAEELQFRDELRAWLSAHAPKDWQHRRDESMEAHFDFLKGWQRTLCDGGWAGLSWPKACGGRGASLMQSVIFWQEMALAGAPPMANVLGLGFWSRFTVTLDFPARKAYLANATRYGWPDLWNASGLRLRPRDAAKIGQLVLNRGQWNGQQIVSADWIAQSITPRFQAVGYFGGTLFYGYQWWMGRSLAGGREIKWVGAFGWGGQRIFIVPELDLVMMTTAAQYGQPKEGLAAIDILSNIVIPSVRDAH